MKALIFTFLLFPFSLLAQLNATLSMDVSICEGSSGASMTFTGSNGTAPYTFTYNINGGSPQTITTSVGNSVSVNVSTVTAGTFNYQLTQVSDDLGANQAVNDNAFATVNPLPIVGAGADQTVCPGISVTLTGTGASTYTWNNGVSNGVSFVPISTSTYTVTGTSNYGCINTDQVIVTVGQFPNINAGPDVTLCSGQSTTLTATGAPYFSWNNGLGNGNNFVVSPPSTLTYTVSGTSAEGCMSTDQITVFVGCTGIDEIKSFVVNVSPNPTNSILNIESESVIDVISVYTSNGQLLKQLTPSSQKSIVDLSDLTQGIYLVEMNSEKGKIVKRIIVQ